MKKKIKKCFAFITMVVAIPMDYIFWNMFFGDIDYRGIKEITAEHMVEFKKY